MGNHDKTTGGDFSSGECKGHPIGELPVAEIGGHGTPVVEFDKLGRFGFILWVVVDLVDHNIIRRCDGCLESSARLSADEAAKNDDRVKVQGLLSG